MRYVLAILALAFSGVLLLLGIGQRTFLAGPSEIVYPITTEGDAPYAVIDGDEFAQVAGQANIVMRGSNAVAIVANTRDAEGWLEPFDHFDVAVDPKAELTDSTLVPGVKPTNDTLETDDNGKALPLDPRGSDLWLETSTGEDGPIRLPVAPGPDQSIIVASNGEEGVPSGAAIVWVQDRSTPFAGPLLVAGGAFALLGAVLYLIAFDRDRRALGPRRGRKGPLLGVRNMVNNRGRRSAAANPVKAEPKRGVLSTAPGLPMGTKESQTQEAEAKPAADATETTEQGEGNDAAQ